MDNSADENSDDGLQIVIESPRPKKRIKKELDETDRKIIACVEKDIEENLEEKAAKTNLTSKHVKNIIKHVVTNEHVLALVRHAENPDENNEPITVYEPKYTRAKTKQLLSANTQPEVIPWASSPKTPSEVHKLFTEELQDDSSGDEYIPKSKKKAVSPENQSGTTQAKPKNEGAERKAANIALRTRSKLSLSHTPLEEIEGAFMPPDITTDMYDMDCDDDVWKEFLKTFTRPLDEVTKAAEDEDHDPEYNILADEEIDEVDKEELRADRAVTVSRKEFNRLMAELFEYADMYESNKLNDKFTADECNSLPAENKSDNGSESDSENDTEISIRKSQIPILAQQMRQHVQMLTQNFLLTYEHPEFYEMALKFKECLLNIKAGSEGKTASIFHVMNLSSALKLIEDWENLFSTKSKKVIETKEYIYKVIVESIQAKLAGTTYIVTFPPLLMETILNNETFLYPNLLPRIPFKSLQVSQSPYYFFTHSEENLIALFLEQAIPVLKQDPFHLTKWKKVNMEHVCHYLHKFLMPLVSPAKIESHIRKRKSPNSEENPIKFYYRNKRAPPAVHYVAPVQEMLPPCKRNPELLPHLWREFLYPGYEKEKLKVVNNSGCHNNQIIIVSSPLKLAPVNPANISPLYNINFAKKIIAERKIQPNGPLPPLINQNRRRRKVKSTTESPKINEESKTLKKENNNMLPDMPSLGGTPVKKQNVDAQATTKNNDCTVNTTKEQDLSFKNITSFSFPHSFEGVCQFSSTFSGQNDPGTNNNSSTLEKDNPEDIHELMIASSTVKNVTKKEPSGAEKKRAKMRREFIANLAMATPDDPETEVQKEESFADSFYEKIKQTLTAEDYDKLIDVLSHYDENNGQFVDLYQNVQSILLPKYKELSDEFLLFLTDIQAHKVGQLMPYFMMKDMSRFMKKLQVYFKEQPSHMKKIIKSLTDLAENPDVTMETIKGTMLPLLKGNSALTDWFLQLFPSEKPPNILTSGPHEIVDITKELSRQPDEEICETVILPDTEDPYGGPTCICTCHNVENPQFKTRSQHCVRCGLKFIQGKIYIQTGKGLRPAIVSFLTNAEKDHTKRLTATQRKRSETSPSKQANSPTKENQGHEETRNSNESDDDLDGNKKKNRRKRKPKQEKANTTKESGKSSKETTGKVDKVKTDNAPSGSKPCKVSVKKQVRKRTNINGKKASEHKPGSSVGQQKRPAEDHSEIESSGPTESLELKANSYHSGESESEFFESSQDITYTESDESSASSASSPLQRTNANGSKRASWTREEDKIILQAFKQRSDNEETFKHISEVLQNRSVIEIKNRFHKLMTLLQQMASNSTS